MFDQLRLAPEQTMVGYVTAEIPEGHTVETVDFQDDFGVDKETLVWRTKGQAVKDAPETPTRTNDKATVHAMADFTMDRISFSPSYGETVATIWITN